MRILRAFSVRQPYAELIIVGKKKFEYRTIPTNIRERVYVYASRTTAPGTRWKESGIAPGSLPMGMLVGTVEIVGCEYKAGEYHWKLARPKRLGHATKPENRPQPVWFRPFGASTAMGHKGKPKA